ncbi:TRAP transporter substrate-binding protein [Hydrogenophaga sp.]|uniref:TRAP transporter substrate-binding protein n=1 Tax=Hydrogenophaga sp. TaxID=1904254 RepID=UPI002ABA1D53|nr:TRAP transporter substrate-binding protein [Hydrogenophaga sp.]MDZ4397523.1 TRAP transporter substrate-binding protein [Hydrogenophaga sp.]
MKRLLSALAICVAVLPTASIAQSEMRYSHFVPPNHPTIDGLTAWAKSLEQAAGGALKVRIFPAEQLGKAKDHYDMVRDGIADAGWVVPGYTPGRFPVVTLLELPFIARNADGGSLAFDTWYRAYSSKEMKDVYFCLAFLQDPGVLHTKRQVKTPEDLRGLKLRSPTVPMSDFFKLVGANSVAIPVPQVREAIERGTIDGAALAWKTAASLGVSKVATFHLDAPIYTVPVTYLINKAFYDRQEPAVRKAIGEHCTPEWGRRVGADWAGHEREGKAALTKEEGHSVVSLSDRDVQEWRAVSLPLVSQWMTAVAKSGVDARAALVELRTLLKRYDAEY